MGKYNSQYESYYSKIAPKRSYSGYNPGNSYRYSSSRKTSTGFSGNYFIKRFVNELIGVFCLLLVVITCKFVITPETTALYNYSKKIVSVNFDYADAYENVKKLKYSDIREYAQSVVKNMRHKMNGGAQNTGSVY